MDPEQSAAGEADFSTIFDEVFGDVEIDGQQEGDEGQPLADPPLEEGTQPGQCVHAPDT
jgi:hypothetical protein